MRHGRLRPSATRPICSSKPMRRSAPSFCSRTARTSAARTRFRTPSNGCRRTTSGCSRSACARPPTRPALEADGRYQRRHIQRGLRLGQPRAHLRRARLQAGKRSTLIRLPIVGRVSRPVDDLGACRRLRRVATGSLSTSPELGTSPRWSSEEFADKAIEVAAVDEIVLVVVMIGLLGLARRPMVSRLRGSAGRFGPSAGRVRDALPVEEEAAERRAEISSIVADHAKKPFKGTGWLRGFAADCELADIRWSPATLLFWPLAAAVIAAVIFMLLFNSPLALLLAPSSRSPVRSYVNVKLSRKRRGLQRATAGQPGRARLRAARRLQPGRRAVGGGRRCAGAFEERAAPGDRRRAARRPARGRLRGLRAADEQPRPGTGRDRGAAATRSGRQRRRGDRPGRREHPRPDGPSPARCKR